MSESSPADLAIAFRSFARRRAEALGDADPGVVADLSRSLDGHVADAAAVLGTNLDATSVAAELDRREPSEWDEATLQQVRRHALEAGAVLRQMQARAAQSTGRAGWDDR